MVKRSNASCWNWNDRGLQNEFKIIKLKPSINEEMLNTIADSLKGDVDLI
jgi:hypothetical protein